MRRVPGAAAAAAPEKFALTIARRGVESITGLGRHGWMVERALAWLLASRRLMVPRAAPTS